MRGVVAPLTGLAVVLLSACGSRSQLEVLTVNAGDASPGAAHGLGISCPQTSVQRDAPWPMPSRCPDNSNYLPVAPLVAPHVAWTTPLVGVRAWATLYSPQGIVSADGVIHFGANVDGAVDLFAVNADGSIRGRTPGGGAPIAIGADGTLYVLDSTDVRALNSDGSVRWTASTNVVQGGVGPLNVMSSNFTLGMGGTAYVLGARRNGPCTENGSVSALRPDGSTSWTVLVPCSEQLVAPSVGADGTLHFASATQDPGPSSHVEAVGPDGTVRWRNDDFAGPPITYLPMVGFDGTTYYPIMTGGTMITRGYGRDGTPRWATNHVGVMAARPDGDVLIFEGRSTLYDFRSDGAIAWSRDLGLRDNTQVVNLIVVDGAIYLAMGCYPTDVACTPALTALSWQGDHLWTLGGLNQPLWMVAGKNAIYALSVDRDSGQAQLVAVSD